MYSTSRDPTIAFARSYHPDNLPSETGKAHARIWRYQELQATEHSVERLYRSASKSSI